MEWLACDLKAAGDRPVIVLIHENLDEREYDGGLDPHVVRNADQVRQVLEEAETVLAVIQAHYHPGLVAEQGGIPYVALQAMAVGPGLESNAFAVVDVGADGSVAVAGYGQQVSCRVQPSRRPAVGTR